MSWHQNVCVVGDNNCQVVVEKLLFEEKRAAETTNNDGIAEEEVSSADEYGTQSSQNRRTDEMDGEHLLSSGDKN
jgi:hypothetical protein